MTKILTALTFAIALGFSLATATAGQDDRIGPRFDLPADPIVFGN